MRTRIAVRAAALQLALLALPASALAGGSVSASAPVSVTILAPVTLQASQALDFGAVTKPANSGVNTVALDADGRVTVTGSGDASHPAGAVSAAKFSLIAQAGLTYSTTQTLTFAQAGLTRAQASAPVAGNGTLGVIPETGTQELRVGAAFDLSAATPTGGYTGALTVTVNYN